jgi:hypothetical protein
METVHFDLSWQGEELTSLLLNNTRVLPFEAPLPCSPAPRGGSPVIVYTLTDAGVSKLGVPHRRDAAFPAGQFEWTSR